MQGTSGNVPFLGGEGFAAAELDGGGLDFGRDDAEGEVETEVRVGDGGEGC